MNSLISLFWQLEVQHIQIPVIAIKNKQEKAQHYFYSQKQGRVLRKKDPKFVEYLDECLKRLNGAQIYQIIRNRKDKTLQIKLVQGSECCENLNDETFEGQFVIIQPDYEVCIIRFFPPKRIEIECLTGELSQKKQLMDWSNKLVKALQNSNMNGKGKHKLNSIEMIIGINDKKGVRIVVIDAMKLRWDNDEDCVMKIMYDPVPKIEKKKQQRRAERQEQGVSMRQKIIGAEEKKGQGRSECCGCNENVGECDMKEITKQELVNIRRMLKLSFRGFNDDYYQVCTDCYSLT